MMKETYEKYRGNFSKFLVYFLLSIIMALFTSKLDLPLIKSPGIDPTVNLNFFASMDFLKFIGISLIQIYITSYGLVLIGKITSGNPVEQKEAFLETFSYYPRLIIINIVVIGIILIIILLLVTLTMIAPHSIGLFTFSSLLLIITITLISIFSGVTQNYLIYYDDSIGFSMKQGIKITKGYFSKILGLFVLSVIIEIFIGGDIFKTNTMTLSIGALLTTLYSVYLNLYIMNLCEKWGRVN